MVEEVADCGNTEGLAHREQYPDGQRDPQGS